jgi:hypothetical protein
MAKSVAELRAAIASGEIKPNSGVRGVSEGLFLCLVEKAAFDHGNAGNLRGAVGCKVLSGGTDTDVGGKFNIYIQTQDEGYMERQIAEWTLYCKAWGIAEDKLYDEAETAIDIVGNIMVCVNKLALKGVLRAQIDRRLSGKMDSKSGKPFYYNNVKEVFTSANSAAEAKANETVKTAAVQAEAQTEKVQTATVNALAADAATRTTPAQATETKKKPWQK